jgi:[acyl-carrier-protein] S-malonyltransferase
MQEAVKGRATAMAAIIGLDAAAIRRVCAAAARHGVVEPTNFNTPGQVVIGGDEAAVREGMALAKSAGARRAVFLSVSAPFHTSLMQPAADRLASVLESIPFKDSVIPVVSNVTAEPVISGTTLRQLLTEQVATAVRWEESVRTIAAGGVSTFVEVGPGTTLTAMIRKTVPEARTLNVEDRASLEATMEQLKGDQPNGHGKA